MSIESTVIQSFDCECGKGGGRVYQRKLGEKNGGKEEYVQGYEQVCLNE